jgi:uncharacterized DUF497 family protein
VKPLRFEWDTGKAAANLRKHGVSFPEAKTVFLDDDALLLSDDDHSSDEDRFIILGISARLRILVVCHCHRQIDEVIRIISAQKSEPNGKNSILGTNNTMKKNYDFSKAVKNPYAKRLKRQLTLQVDADTLAYFQDMAKEIAIPYQTLMNMYLRECADSRKRLRLHWKPIARHRAA